MSEHPQLLEEARGFCDPETGEVVERIPDDLMEKLRAEGLARGIPGRPSQRSGSSATWFVFLNDEIREHVLAEWRTVCAARKRDRKGKKSKAAGEQMTESPSPEEPRGGRGLKEFRQRRKPN